MKRLVFLLAFLVLVNVTMASEYIEREFILSEFETKDVSIDVERGETLYYLVEITHPKEKCFGFREEYPEGGHLDNECISTAENYREAGETGKFRFQFSNTRTTEDISIYFKYKIFPREQAPPFPEEPEPAPTPCAPLGFLLLVPLMAIAFRKG